MTTPTRGVRAYYAIFGSYGFWLPNDPRRSWSDFVRSWELFRAGGPATKVDTRRSVAGQPHDRQARLQVKEALQLPPVVFDGHQALSIAHGFARMVDKAQYQIYACSILPEHVHLVRAIRYVEGNPIKEGKRRQHWPFVVPFTPTMDV
jgi:hypothetical protein